MHDNNLLHLRSLKVCCLLLIFPSRDIFHELILSWILPASIKKKKRLIIDPKGTNVLLQQHPTNWKSPSERQSQHGFLFTALFRRQGIKHTHYLLSLPQFQMMDPFLMEVLKSMPGTTVKSYEKQITKIFNSKSIFQKTCEQTVNCLIPSHSLRVFGTEFNDLFLFFCLS